MRGETVGGANEKSFVFEVLGPARAAGMFTFLLFFSGSGKRSSKRK